MDDGEIDYSAPAKIYMFDEAFGTGIYSRGGATWNGELASAVQKVINIT